LRESAAADVERQCHGVGCVDTALAMVAEITPSLDGYHLLHATAGELLVLAGRGDEARAAFTRARALTGNHAEHASPR
jgi:RNA polymerase sigma-70 factor (ECF subfamily)